MALHAERDPRVSVGSQWVIFLSDGSGKIGQGLLGCRTITQNENITSLGWVIAASKLYGGLLKEFPRRQVELKRGQGNRRQVRGCVADRFKEEKWKAQTVSREMHLT
jgi:hypothetical protein